MGAKDSSSPPDYAALMRQGFELQREFAPKYARQEYQLRQKFDPKLIREQQGLQARFGPTQYAQQLAALQQLDPQRQTAYRQAAAIAARDQARGYIDPRQEALYNLMATQTRGELARGRGLSPEMQRETEQALRAGQSARGNIYGNAPLSAEALYKGARGQQLYQQRLQNAQSVYQQQTGREKASAQAGGIYGSGGYQSPISQIQGIQGVQAPRGFGYVNPQAGAQAAQFALANYPNQAAAGGANPWMGALSGAAAGAQAGTMISPGYGTAIGAVVGGLGGGLGTAYSDERLKERIVDTGKKTKDGIPIVEFSYRNRIGRYRGVTAQETWKVRPDAVDASGGEYFMVNYGALGLELERID